MTHRLHARNETASIQRPVQQYAVKLNLITPVRGSCVKLTVSLPSLCGILIVCCLDWLHASVPWHKQVFIVSDFERRCCEPGAK